MNGPLDGISLVSVALNIPGPVAVARLVEMGASATTVLPPAGDPLQIYRQAWFDELHRDHDVLTLDLKQDAERRQMHALLAQADVFLTSSRPSALRRLGLDFEKLVARHPRLCQVDIVGYPGDAGEVAGHDLTYQAVHGLVRGEQLPPTLSVDLMGAERAVTEVLAVLRERSRSRVGARRQVVLSEMADLLSAPLRHGLTTPGGLLGAVCRCTASIPRRRGGWRWRPWNHTSRGRSSRRWQVRDGQPSATNRPSPNSPPDASGRSSPSGRPATGKSGRSGTASRWSPSPIHGPSTSDALKGA